MSTEEYNLLYVDDNGDTIGIYEMQLIDPPLVDRQPLLRKLLSSTDRYVAFQAAEILTAWGDEQGVLFFDSLISSWPSESHFMYDHRIYGIDYSLDQVAKAMHLYLFLSNGSRDRARVLYIKLLELYGSYYFESKLKHSLLDWDDGSLTEHVYAAICRSRDLGRNYLASQLLPPLARWQSDKSITVLMPFLQLDDEPSPKINVAESLQYLTPVLATPFLESLCNDHNIVVSNQAKESLAKFSH